ncbi:MAG: hypothetical protein BWK80_12400 [Desulfobacteraceae bacterium IS3]|nr:MAG: hypothetical protein BWK80_12400 [Desulfobacteraceae bacterium IS3]
MLLKKCSCRRKSAEHFFVQAERSEKQKRFAKSFYCKTALQALSCPFQQSGLKNRNGLQNRFTHNSKFHKIV